jgi:hypothetical protein
MAFVRVHSTDGGVANGGAVPWLLSAAGYANSQKFWKREVTALLSIQVWDPNSGAGG